MNELMQMMADHFPFLNDEAAALTLRLCKQNHRLFHYPERQSLLGFYQFYPELINVVRNQDFEVLMQCNLTEGPLIYFAVLILPQTDYKMLYTIRRVLNARAYAFHRYTNGEFEFHFVRNNHYGQTDAHIN